MDTLLIVAFTIILILIYIIVWRNNVSYVINRNDNKEYLVKNLPDKESASELLGLIYENLNKLINHLHNNIQKYPEQKDYIKLLWDRTRKITISENHNNASQYTTYTVNKGEEIVFCLRDENGNLHDVNLLLFVAIHELAHVACPELNHTQLFISIFVFLLKTAISLGVYKYQDYNKNPVNYCGMYLNQSPL